MIVRHYVRCNYCEKITLLRLGVGYETDQPFGFRCEGCSEDISGLLHTDQTTGEIKGLSIGNAVQVDISKHDFIFTHHPDFPTQNSRGDEFSNPFLQAFGRYGESVLDRSRRTLTSQRFASELVPSVSRLIRHYKAEQWKLFKKDALEILPDNWSFDHQIDRNRALYQYLEIVLMPLVTSQTHVDLIIFLTGYVENISRNNRKAFKLFIEAVDKQSELLKRVQFDALDLVPRFLELTKEFQEVTVDWDPENPNSPFPSDFDVHGAGEFHRVKSLFVDAYEVICRGLTLVVGVMNIHIRNDADIFAVDPSDKKARPFAKSLIKFHNAAHGRKTQLLTEDVVINEWLSDSLDSRLRNAIGHNTIVFDVSSSTVTYPVDRSGRNFKTISYGEFLTKVLRAFVRAHEINHLVKIIYICRILLIDKKS